VVEEGADGKNPPQREGAAKFILGTGLIQAILEVQDIHTYYGDAYLLQGFPAVEEDRSWAARTQWCGQTTLVNSIVGFTPPAAVRILFKGVDITGSPRSKRCAWNGSGAPGRRVFPSPERQENLSVARRNTGRKPLESGAGLRALPAPEGAARAAGQDAVRGEQQMLAIGRQPS